MPGICQVAQKPFCGIWNDKPGAPSTPPACSEPPAEGRAPPSGSPGRQALAAGSRRRPAPPQGRRFPQREGAAENRCRSHSLLAREKRRCCRAGKPPAPHESGAIHVRLQRGARPVFSAGGRAPSRSPPCASKRQAARQGLTGAGGGEGAAVGHRELIRGISRARRGEASLMSLKYPAVAFKPNRLQTMPPRDRVLLAIRRG